MHRSPIRLTRRQVREVDRLTIEEYGLPGIVLMENAARAVSDAAWTLLDGQAGRSVLILCGGGNNGGDGFAAARHLHNRGIAVTMGITTDPSRYTGDAKVNYDAIRRMGITCQSATPQWIAQQRCDLVLDAIFGTGLTQPPRPPFEQIAASVNGWGRRVLAVDIPSGLDCDTGLPLGSCIRAMQTVTFVAEKVGFAAAGSAAFTGEILIGDIGCPRELIERVVREA